MKNRSMWVGGVVLMAATLTACQSDVTAPTEVFKPSFAVTVDGTTGIGFVGKGDVQLVYGWNNKALQENAGLVRFRLAASTVTEVTWTCRNSNNQQTQERERTTTTTTQGVLSSIARERNQITGFNLTGFDGNPTVGTPTTEGPPLNSCPNPNSGWFLETPAGDPVIVEQTSGMEVSIAPPDWRPIG